MYVATQIMLMNTLASQLTTLGTSVSIKLFSNNFTPSNQSILSDFTEADFTGYLAVATTGYTAPAWVSNNAAVAYSLPLAAFNTASPYTVGQTIYGYYLVSGTGSPVLIGAERFLQPMSMIGAGNQILISAPISVADAGIPGQVF
jgi:hypothetical protein